MWTEIIKFVGLGGIIIAAIAWLSRRIIVHILSKDIEKYKIQLKAGSDIEIEKLRSSLQMEAFEHDVRFSKLHEKRADVIAELYSKMVEMISAATSFASFFEFTGEISKSEKYKIAGEKFKSFFIYFDKNQIFLKEQMCSQIKDLVVKIRKPSHELFLFIEEEEHTNLPVQGKIAAWTKAWEQISESEVPKARKALEDEFRNILGVLDSTGEQK